MHGRTVWRMLPSTHKDLSILVSVFVFSMVWDSSEPFRDYVFGMQVPLRDCWKLDWCLSIVLLSVSPAYKCIFINFPVSCSRISDLHLLHYCIEQLSSRDVGGGVLWWPWGFHTLLPYCVYITELPYPSHHICCVISCFGPYLSSDCLIIVCCSTSLTCHSHLAQFSCASWNVCLLYSLQYLELI